MMVRVMLTVCVLYIHILLLFLPSVEYIGKSLYFSTFSFFLFLGGLR